MKKEWKTPVLTVLLKGKLEGGFLACHSGGASSDPYHEVLKCATQLACSQ